MLHKYEKQGHTQKRWRENTPKNEKGKEGEKEGGRMRMRDVRYFKFRVRVRIRVRQIERERERDRE